MPRGGASATGRDVVLGPLVPVPQKASGAELPDAQTEQKPQDSARCSMTSHRRVSSAMLMTEANDLRAWKGHWGPRLEMVGRRCLSTEEELSWVVFVFRV